VRVAVTGAGGQLGRAVAARFGHVDVVALERSVLDVTDRDATVGALTAVAPDIVVHCAAWTDVDACEADPDRAFAVNALGTRHVVDGVRRVGAHLVYVSTDYVFDGTLDRAYHEWDVPNPLSVYGHSKRAGELEVPPEHTIVRTSWLFGRHAPSIVTTILRLASERDTLPFVDDQRGCPTEADGLAGVVHRLAVDRMPGTYHVTHQGAVSWFGFAQAVLDAAGLDPERVRPIATAELEPPRPARRPANSVLDNAALRLAGLTLLPDFREVLPPVVAALRDAPR
jgi:dTDP-4-dehydrorhamnose reductase